MLQPLTEYRQVLNLEDHVQLLQVTHPQSVDPLQFVVGVHLPVVAVHIHQATNKK